MLDTSSISFLRTSSSAAVSPLPCRKRISVFTDSIFFSATFTVCTCVVIDASASIRTAMVWVDIDLSEPARLFASANTCSRAEAEAGLSAAVRSAFSKLSMREPSAPGSPGTPRDFASRTLAWLSVLAWPYSAPRARRVEVASRFMARLIEVTDTPIPSPPTTRWPVITSRRA